jgi:hypothetical protein
LTAFLVVKDVRVVALDKFRLTGELLSTAVTHPVGVIDP